MVWLCCSNTALPEEIKTIDGGIIKGEVIAVDEEYISLAGEQNNITFIQWRIISLITRDKEIIIADHEGKRIKFSILTTPVDGLHAGDIHLATTDKISALYPEKMPQKQPSVKGTEVQASLESQMVARKKGVILPEDPSRMKKSWKGNIDAGITIKKGNEESVTTSIKTGLLREGSRDIFSFNSLILLETKNGEKSADEQRGTFKYERKHKKRLYSFYQESLEHDEIEKLSLRSISSSGMGYRFILRETMEYKSEIGPSFTYEDFRDNLQTNVGFRLGNYLDWKITPNIKYYFKVDFLPVVEDFEAWRVESDTGIRYNINKSLSVNLNWINDYDNKPVKRVNKNDAKILGTIGYNF